ncbi:hypothetical protein, partial [Clavibacter michiganensis]|uniref:hypothetical protein n=1 Tax=Clavibacter michiganensis TaxID=28447 RepID=UPI00292F61EC
MVQPDDEGWPPEDGGRGALAGGRAAAFAAAAAALPVSGVEPEGPVVRARRVVLDPLDHGRGHGAA